jgi:type I restriction enzyme M protein
LYHIFAIMRHTHPFPAPVRHKKPALAARAARLRSRQMPSLTGKTPEVTARARLAEDSKTVLKMKRGRGKGSLYGAFDYQAQVVQFQPDSDLRDNEDVPLTAEIAVGANVNAVNEAYFNKEVAPHVKDAWIDAGNCDDRDEQIGVVGYEIPFNRHFYQHESPRDLADIDADLDVLSAEIMEMLREVHS